MAVANRYLVLDRVTSEQKVAEQPNPLPISTLIGLQRPRLVFFRGKSLRLDRQHREPSQVSVGN